MNKSLIFAATHAQVDSLLWYGKNVPCVSVTLVKRYKEPGPGVLRNDSESSHARLTATDHRDNNQANGGGADGKRSKSDGPSGGKQQDALDRCQGSGDGEGGSHGRGSLTYDDGWGGRKWFDAEWETTQPAGNMAAEAGPAAFDVSRMQQMLDMQQ